MMVFRRLLVVVVGVGLLLATAPPARGATSLDVSFPDTQPPEYLTVVGDVTFPANCTGSGNMAGNSEGSWPNTLEGTQVNSWGDSWGSGSGGNCRSENNGSGYVRFQAWRYDFQEGAAYRFTTAWYGGSVSRCVKWVWWNAATSTDLGTVGEDCGVYDGAGALHTFAAVGAAPAGATAIRFAAHPFVFYTEHHVRGESTPEQGGDCQGIGNLATGGTYVADLWGAWFDQTYDLCRSSGGLTTTVDIEVEVPGGVLVSFNSSFCTDGNPRSIRWYFVTETVVLLAGGYSVTTACAATAGDPPSRVIGVNAPGGVIGLRAVIDKMIWQELHHIVLDIAPEDFYAEQPGGSAAETCEVPDGGWLDIDWLGYIGCVVVGGFSALVDTFVFWISNLPGFIAIQIGELLTSLLVPTEIGEAWSDFVDTLSGKVPFGWLAEAMGVLDDFLSPSISGPALPVSLSLMGGTVAVDTSVTEPVEQFRPALVAVVYVGLAVAVVRLIRGSLSGGDG